MALHLIEISVNSCADDWNQVSSQSPVPNERKYRNDQKTGALLLNMIKLSLNCPVVGDFMRSGRLKLGEYIRNN